MEKILKKIYKEYKIVFNITQIIFLCNFSYPCIIKRMVLYKQNLSLNQKKIILYRHGYLPQNIFNKQYKYLNNLLLIKDPTTFSSQVQALLTQIYHSILLDIDKNYNKFLLFTGLYAFLPLILNPLVIFIQKSFIIIVFILLLALGLIISKIFFQIGRKEVKNIIKILIINIIILLFYLYNLSLFIVSVILLKIINLRESNNNDGIKTLLYKYLLVIDFLKRNFSFFKVIKTKDKIFKSYDIIKIRHGLHPFSVNDISIKIFYNISISPKREILLKYLEDIIVYQLKIISYLENKLKYMKNQVKYVTILVTIALAFMNSLFSLIFPSNIVFSIFIVIIIYSSLYSLLFREKILLYMPYFFLLITFITQKLLKILF